jgi:hypothetical protein
MKDPANGTTKNGRPGEAKEFLPPLEFSSLVLPLYMPALIKLGLIEDPTSGRFQPNLDHGRRLIDLLDLLKEKTEGNLEPEEERFLSSAIMQLKEAYLRQTSGRKD